jgi:hypothetical protein
MYGQKGGLLITLDAVRNGIQLGMDGLTFDEVRGCLRKAMFHYDALEKAQRQQRLDGDDDEVA